MREIRGGGGFDDSVEIPNSDKIKINYIAGVINEEDGLRFKRILFRVSKGNIYVALHKTYLAPEEVQMKIKHGVFIYIYRIKY